MSSSSTSPPGWSFIPRQDTRAGRSRTRFWRMFPGSQLADRSVRESSTGSTKTRRVSSLPQRPIAGARALVTQWESRSVEKTYLALVSGSVADEEAIIDAPIGRDPKNRQRMAVVRSGRPAVTRFRVVERFPSSHAARGFDRDRAHAPDSGPSGLHRSPNRRGSALWQSAVDGPSSSNASFSMPVRLRFSYQTVSGCDWRHLCRTSCEPC